MKMISSISSKGYTVTLVRNSGILLFESINETQKLDLLLYNNKHHGNPTKESLILLLRRQTRLQQLLPRLTIPHPPPPQAQSLAIEDNSILEIRASDVPQDRPRPIKDSRVAPLQRPSHRPPRVRVQIIRRLARNIVLPSLPPTPRPHPTLRQLLHRKTRVDPSHPIRIRDHAGHLPLQPHLHPEEEPTHALPPHHRTG